MRLRRTHVTVEIYDPSTDKWEQGTDMTEGKWVFGASSVDGNVYVFGGWNGRIIPTVEELDTGFVPSQSVNPAGKLTTTWGEIKARN